MVDNTDLRIAIIGAGKDAHPNTHLSFTIH